MLMTGSLLRSLVSEQRKEAPTPSTLCSPRFSTLAAQGDFGSRRISGEEASLRSWLY